MALLVAALAATEVAVFGDVRVDSAVTSWLVATCSEELDAAGSRDMVRAA